MDRQTSKGTAAENDLTATPPQKISPIPAPAVTCRHRVATRLAICTLIAAALGTIASKLLPSIPDQPYFWMAGYIVGFSFSAAVHELVAPVIGQPSELGRYLPWIAQQTSLRKAEAPSLELGVKTDVKWFVSLTAFLLIVLISGLILLLTWRVQTEITYTSALTIPTIIGAVVYGEIVLPHIAIIQGRKALKLAAEMQQTHVKRDAS